MKPSQRRPGFTIPGYAAAAARKGHELKTCHEWTPEEARAQGRKAAAKRWGVQKKYEEVAHG